MVSRLIIVIFTIAFIAYTWITSSKAHSQEINQGPVKQMKVRAVNDPKGACKCHARLNCSTGSSQNIVNETKDEQTYEEECDKDSFCKTAQEKHPNCPMEECDCNEWGVVN